MLLTVLSCLVQIGIATAAGPTVTLDSGILEGISTTLQSNRVVHKYLGVPFAKPPKRFAPPESLDPSTRLLKVDTKGPACIEIGASGAAVPNSEDCLFLNIYTPAPTAGAKADKVVMVWLFGGGLQFGSASTPTYDGTSFAANQDVVLVGINYRTNLFGFPGPVPGLPKEQQNLGFLDQRMALSWIQKNIAKFGGDPDKVTIFGESAGARSVDQLLLTSGPPKKPMFRAVIMQSGSASLNPGTQGLGSLQTKESSENTSFTELAKLAGCNVPAQALDCLRNKPLSAVTSAQAQARAKGIASPGATYDGGVTTALDAETLRKERKVANVSLLIGSNADESRTTPSGGSSLAIFLDRTFGNDAAKKEAARKAYPVGKDELFKTESEAIYAMSTDVQFSCVVAREAASSASAGYRKYCRIRPSSIR
jgi:carboxylesterase type B